MTIAAERGLRADAVDPRQADRALDAIEALLGPEAVHRSAEVRAEFTDPYRAEGTTGAVPSGVVMPTSTEQVSQVVKVANEHGVPLWTSSQGRNFGYGGAEARVAGSISLSLRRMNRVLEVDEEQGYAVVQPGATFFDLYEALGSSDHRWWLSCPDLGRGSVVGNALENGMGYTPMGEHSQQLCGMEVVLPDGEVLRTGTGGALGTKTRFVQKRGFGPSLDGLFVQSNMGIVTEVGVWLMPAPECYSPGVVIARREEDLEQLVDTLRGLMRDGTITGYPLIVHGFGPVSMAVPRDQWPPLSGPGTAQELAPVLGAMGLGTWMMRFALYGHSDVVELNRARVEKAFGAIPDAVVVMNSYTAPFTRETVPVMDQVPAGIPNMDVLNTLNAWGGEGPGGHMDFSPVTPFTGRDAATAYRALFASWHRHDVKSVYSIIARDRSLVHVNMGMYEIADTAAVASAQAACAELVQVMHELGYGEYRSHPDLADAVADTYDYNDHVLGRTLRRIKDALDPQGVLSPGSKGVWPSARPRHLSNGGPQQ